MDLGEDVAARSGEFWLKFTVTGVVPQGLPLIPPVLRSPLLVHPQFIY
jgi:hypothetical protein